MRSRLRQARVHHRWLRDIEGYHGFLMLSQEGSAIGLTFWESRDVAEHHRTVRMQFIERMTVEILNLRPTMSLGVGSPPRE